MKKIVLIVGLLFIGHLANAQDMNKALATAKERYEKYDKVLNFSDEQKEKVKNLLDGIEQKQEYVRTSDAMSEDLKQESISKNKEAFQRIFISYLTEEQKVKYKANFTE